jgi:hypothetical protein
MRHLPWEHVDARLGFRLSRLSGVGQLRVAALTCAAIAAGCSTPCGVGPRPSLVESLLGISASPDPAESTSALLLLADLALPESVVKRLSDDFHGASDHTRKLVLAFVLEKRTQQTEWRGAFVELYPVGKGQEAIWGMTSLLPRANASPPLQQRLAEIALSDETALAKLISGLPYSDGAVAETTCSQIDGLLGRHPAPVETALRKAGISMRDRCGSKEPEPR